MFRDRIDAAEQLAALVEERSVEVDLVLAIPRGGLPLGRVIADHLDRPLDIVVARKIGAPSNPELAIGAVASDGTTWLNEPLIANLGVSESYIDEARAAEGAAAEEKLRRYRGERDPPAVAGKHVLVVDDGVATGATTTACLRHLRGEGAAAVTLAVPVGSRQALEALRTEADQVLCLETPDPFGAVGQYFASFEQVSDEEARAFLAGSKH
jgi:putative phosphoribosyl transferase